METDVKSQKKEPVGGQAVIEGVMMRASDVIATAVRKPNSEIVVKKDVYVALSKRHRILNIPILRGTVSLFEMLILGIKTLFYSADVAMEETPDTEGRKKSFTPNPNEKRTEIVLGITLILALALGVGIFFLLPLFLTGLFGFGRDALAFNAIAGGFRIALFLTYLWLISLWGETNRIFQYHGAEHKCIFAFEADEKLTVESARKYGTSHPRCGTSFLLTVAIVAILIFSIADSSFVSIVGRRQSLLERFATHLLFLPLIAGVSYELLRLSGRKRNHKTAKLLISPGLWLQRITTKEPDDGQLEVALMALKSALEGDQRQLEVGGHS